MCKQPRTRKPIVDTTVQRKKHRVEVKGYNHDDFLINVFTHEFEVTGIFKQLKFREKHLSYIRVKGYIQVQPIHKYTHINNMD